MIFPLPLKFRFAAPHSKNNSCLLLFRLSSLTYALVFLITCLLSIYFPFYIFNLCTRLTHVNLRPEKGFHNPYLPKERGKSGAGFSVEAKDPKCWWELTPPAGASVTGALSLIAL